MSSPLSGRFTESSTFAWNQRFRPVQAGNPASVSVDTDVLPPRYRGPRRIGRGGMGDIFRATDDTLGRAVAVKVLAERYAEDEAVRERFTREALAAARLSGRPSVVTIFDVGEWEGRPYIVMEYLAGGSLDDRLRAGRVAPAQALEWLEQAAAALDAAHAEGVVHRDVKPGNLLLDRDDNVHVADFGIASAAGMDSLTKTGTVLGTAAYLSPEQAQGERATRASDLYALGVVAWELLTGRRPFRGDTPAAEASAHVHAPVPAISDADDDLPLELDAVFARALAKDPRRRYPSASDFVADLRNALHTAADRTEIVAPVAPREPFRPAAPSPYPMRRARPAWVVPALVLLALLGAGVLLGALLLTDDDESSGAGATTIVRTVTQQGQAERVTVTAQTETQEPTEQPTNLSVADARALQDQSSAELRNGNWSQALALAQQALPALRGRDTTYEAYANYNIGAALAHLGRCEEAIPYLDRREAMLGPHPDVTAARQQCGA